MEIRLSSETNNKGVSDEIWHLWPLKIGGVGDKHLHNSDHAECDFMAKNTITYNRILNYRKVQGVWYNIL